MVTAFHLLCVLLACLVMTVAARAAGDPQTPGEAKFEVTLKYLVYLPDGYAADKQNKAGDGRGWPLVLFLHGSGERGDDVQAVTNTGLPSYIKGGKKLPCVVVSPQCPKDQWWDAQLLKKLIDELQIKYGTDADRLYVTGLSMGGFGTWELITRYPKLFAALVTARKQLTALPVWAFHGQKDVVVPVARTTDMVEALKKIGNPNVKATIYPDLEHDSWTATYGNDDLYSWLLAQRRVKPAEPK